jgi:predicted enzyme related to lactoylglutathione lyase
MGGLLQTKEAGGSLWLPYVTVGDLVAATAKAKGLGAEALKENQEVPGMGRYSLLRDPTGATFGLWQQNPKTNERA